MPSGERAAFGSAGPRRMQLSTGEGGLPILEARDVALARAVCIGRQLGVGFAAREDRLVA